MDKKQMKEALREVLIEYIDENVNKFGWFSLKTISVVLVLVIMAVAYKFGIIG
jgi:hypothetical protein